MAPSVDATIRITPGSLLWSSALGTTAIATGALPLVLWWTDGGLGLSPLASTVSLAAGLGGVLLFVFSVGYRRHGRPVPTTARIDGERLVVGVPDEWGRLIREALRIAVTETASSDDALVVRGTAEEWWDPGRYEIRVSADAADGLEQGLAETGE
jgi:hypothetical protein